MEADQLRFILQELRFSAVLPVEGLGRLAEESTVRRVAAGEVVFRDGSTNNNLYLIRSGRLALEMNVPGRGAVRILTLGAGEMVGWSALLGQGKMTAGAIAIEDSDVVVASADRLRELCEADRDFGFLLMRQMADALSKRLVATRLQLLDLFADAPSLIPTQQAD
ncbi:MAG: Crp/Fnr family transcriptional regulator [Planctomycetes bacterium]|nr:Crp/Fnr family transcriptional regulator [Planctomycetota bacterium]